MIMGNSDEKNVKTPKLLYTLSEKDKEIFANYQLTATQDEIKKNQYWKASSLERIGEKVIM